MFDFLFDFLTDQSFLSALAAMIGPLAFFAAPTEEVEFLLLTDIADTNEAPSAVLDQTLIEPPMAEAA